MQAWHPEPVEIRTLKALITRHQAVEKDLQRESNRLEKVMVNQVSAVVLNSIQSMIEVLKIQKQSLQSEIDRHIKNQPGLKNDRKLLESIPGVGPVIATLMLSVIGSRDFASAKNCSAFLGLNPVQYESGSSVCKRPRLSKRGDATVRAKLYMAAIVATQYNPDIKRQYERLLKKGKSKMSALGAAMRKLVQICFGVLKHQCEYQPQFKLAAG
jgi:transposase